MRPNMKLTYKILALSVSLAVSTASAQKKSDEAPKEIAGLRAVGSPSNPKVQMKHRKELLFCLRADAKVHKVPDGYKENNRFDQEKSRKICLYSVEMFSPPVLSRIKNFRG